MSFPEERNPQLHRHENDTTQAMYAHRNNSCCGKTVSVAYSERVFVALGVQHAKRMSLIIF